MRLFILLLLLFLIGLRPSDADTTAYRIAPEDVLTISVVNFPNLNTQTAVPPDGKITVPLLSPVLVVGKTTQEVAATLTKQWSEYVIGPAVTVALSQKHKESVYLLGAVSRPGPIEFSAPLRVLQALAAAGGGLPRSDLSHISVTHRTGIQEVLDLSSPEDKGGTSADILLSADDVIQIPERHTEFSVVGEVARPGSYDYKDNMTVLDALTEVGGIKDTADLNDATLVHDGYERRIDLDAILRHGDMADNVKMAAGDRLMIPEANNRTYVFGAVAHPGYYTFKPGDRILDALNGVGGPAQTADLKNVNFIHIDKHKNVANVQKINVENFLKNGDLRGNSLLEPGDVLFVADKKRGFRLDDVWLALSTLNLANSGASILAHGL